MDRTASATGIAREYRTVFDLGGVPAYQQFYDNGIYIWKDVYRGYYRPWHLIAAPTIANPQATRQLYRLNTAKAVCAELASLVWSEECEVNVSINGRESTDENPDPLNAFVQHVLAENAFSEKMQEVVEQAAALGGSAMKVWYDTQRSIDGAEISGRDGIRIGYAMSDQFVPLTWDNARVHECVFISRTAKRGWYYTRLEWHTWTGETYTVRNELYRADRQKGSTGDSQDILGIRVPLAEMFPYLEEETIIPVGESLFCYWRTPVANNIDDNSPLGVSIYGNAMETLHALDICYDSFVREFRLGKKRIIVPVRAVRTVVDPETGMTCRYFDANDETYEAVATDDPNDLKITDNSVELRVQEHIDAINAFLNVLCLQLGFSAGTFTFDASQGMMTATQVISQNSKTYKTVKTMQNQLRPALEHLVRNIIDVAILYGLQWEGQSVESLARAGYNVNVVFDDGVTQDRQTNLNEGVMLVGAGLLSKYTFLTDKKYGQGLTKEQAEEELKRIKEENGSAVDVTKLFGGME